MSVAQPWDSLDPHDALAAHTREYGRWWRWAVMRGPGAGVNDGKWVDLDDEVSHWPFSFEGFYVEATGAWEQHDDGRVGVVYEVWER